MPLIFDMRWKESSAQPVFQTIENGKKQEHILELGKPFCCTLHSSSPSCVGSFKNNEYKPCPTNAQNTKKCEACKKMDDYFPCQFCNGFNCIRFSPEKIENCDADHMVYLALFSADVVKVGVSRISRGKARQFEQGSHATRIFATGISGVQARRIETNLMKIGFLDKIPATQKKTILFPEISFDSSVDVLESKYQFAKDHIASMMPEMKKYLVLNEVWDMRSFYAGSSDAFEELEKNPKPVHFLSLQQNDQVGGVLKMVKGSYLVIETPTELVSILGKELVGHSISFDPCKDGISLASGGFQGAFF